MSQSKDKVPAHIQPKKFNHPSASRIMLILNEIEDLRQPSCHFHPGALSLND